MVSSSSFGLPMHAQLLRLFVTTRPTTLYKPQTATSQSSLFGCDGNTTAPNASTSHAKRGASTLRGHSVCSHQDSEGDQDPSSIYFSTDIGWAATQRLEWQSACCIEGTNASQKQHDLSFIRKTPPQKVSSRSLAGKKRKTSPEYQSISQDQGPLDSASRFFQWHQTHWNQCQVTRQ